LINAVGINNRSNAINREWQCKTCQCSKHHKNHCYELNSVKCHGNLVNIVKINYKTALKMTINRFIQTNESWRCLNWNFIYPVSWKYIKVKLTFIPCFCQNTPEFITGIWFNSELLTKEKFCVHVKYFSVSALTQYWVTLHSVYMPSCV
jgi:hypothetical protein